MIHYEIAKIKKPKNKKTLAKVKEQWFQDGLAFRQTIDYNKITWGSMWTKGQQADLDASELKLMIRLKPMLKVSRWTEK